MKNIFVTLKSGFVFKGEGITKIIEDEDNQQINEKIENFCEQDHNNDEYVNFIFELCEEKISAEAKEKLVFCLVYFVANSPKDKAKNIVEKVLKMNQSLLNKVRFCSNSYKSIEENQLKKYLLVESINLISSEAKISYFSAFVQNFDTLMQNLIFSENQFLEIYLKLINYLQKHLVYKNLWFRYLVRCLLQVEKKNALTKEVDILLIKLLKQNEVIEQTYQLIEQQNIKQNPYYQFLQVLLYGDFIKFNEMNKESLKKGGIDEALLLKNIKIQAIPRVFSGIKIISYIQISEILKIKKEQVEEYIIQAIQQGILKAKIDEFKETVLVKSIKLRSLRTEEEAKLQKDISNLVERLEKISVSN